MNSHENPFLRLDNGRSTSLAAHPSARAPLTLLRKARYPNLYVWFVFLAAMDVMMTWLVLAAGGNEENVLAHWFLAKWGLPGMVVLKFTAVIVVVFICELVGRFREATGQNLARFAVAINVIPVTLAFVQLLINKFAGGDNETEAVVQAVGAVLAAAGFA